MFKKIIYGAVTALLLLSLLFSTSLTHNGTPAPTKILDAEALSYTQTLQNVICTCDVGTVTHLPDEHEAQIALSLSDASCTLFALHYNGKLPADFEAKLYVANKGEFYENKYATPLSINTEGVLYFIIEKNDTDEPDLLFSFSEKIEITRALTFASTGEAVIRTFHPLPLIIFGGALLLLLACEKKLRYYGFIAELVKREIAHVKKLANAPQKRFLMLHLGALGSTALFLLLTAVFLTLTIYTKVSLLLIFILAFLSVMLQLADRLLSKHASEPAKLFLVVALLVGVMFCYTSPVTTHTSWDDEIHLRKVFTVSGVADSSPSLAVLKLYSLGYRVNNYLDDPGTFVRIMVEEDAIAAAACSFDFGNPYTVISYLPAIVTTGIANVFDADLPTMLVLCRAANMISYALIVFMGLRRLKSGVLIFSSVALMPAVLYLGSCIGYDFWLTSWLIYAFAYLFSILQNPDGKLRGRDLVKILLAFFIGCSAKSLYCILLIPLFFIRKCRFEKPQHAYKFRIATALVMLLIFAILLIPGITVYDLYTDTRGGADVNSAEQIRYILTHPFRYAGVLFRHIYEHLSFKNLNEYSAVYGFLDGYLGSNELLYGTVAILVLFFCLLTDNKSTISQNGSRYLRLFVVLACLLQMIFVATSMYIGFNSTGATSISGCQFRYIFPCLAPAAFCIAPRRLRVSVDIERRNGIVYGILALNALVGFCCTYLYKFWM